MGDDGEDEDGIFADEFERGTNSDLDSAKLFESDADAGSLELDAVSKLSESELGSSTSSGARCSKELNLLPLLVVKRSSLDPAALGQ